MNSTFIFNPNSNKTDDLYVEYFSTFEDKDFIDDNGNFQQSSENKNTLAKKIIKDKNIFYYIKTSTGNKLFNPFSKLDREKSYSFLDNVIKPTDKYASVNYKTFEHYLKFLNSKNESWLNISERERL